MQRLTPSAPVPSTAVPTPVTSPSPPLPPLRFAGDLLMWIGVPSGTAIGAVATGCVVQATAPSAPGIVAGPCTIYQLSPLPQVNPAAFNLIPGGLPVQIVIVTGTGPANPATDDLVLKGAPLVTAPAGAGSTAFFAFAFQDRLCRDPLTCVETIALSNDCDGNWPQFENDLAALASARNLRILDHRGVPLNSGTAPNPPISLDITIGGAKTTVVFPPNADGDSGLEAPVNSVVTVASTAPSLYVLAAGEADGGEFINPFQLAAGKRMVQMLDANAWLAQPDAGVSVQRYNRDSFVEPIQDGNPYFARLVTDLRSAKPNGAAGLAGWAFVKGSLADSTVDWPLIPGDDSTTLLNLIKELNTAGVNVRLLVNKFLQFDSQSIDDFPELIPILFVLYLSLSPLQALLKLQTDPQGYAIGLLAVGALGGLVTSSLSLDLIQKNLEFSKDFMDAVSQQVGPSIATWTPYPAAFSDNPLVLPPPPKILGHTIDDVSHIGVYHQKYVNILTAAGQYVSYLGGIDINCDRPDTPLHRVLHPFHDVQVRVTGPAVMDLLLSFQERAKLYQAQVPIPPPAAGSIPTTGSHLVQIARTYFKPAPGSATPPFTFAPNGETTPIRTIKMAIEQARDFIYIEDQYFTPPDDYVQALLDAAKPERGVRALIITMPYTTDQPYGSVRRADLFNALTNAWGGRCYIGTPLRRYLHEIPGLVTNLGRMTLASPLSKTATVTTADLSPIAHIPKPPFWAFIGNELALISSIAAPAGLTSQSVNLVRATAAQSWGANLVDHPVGTPVLAVQVPGIYVHAKVMIVDDVFLFAGSSNLNRRGTYHDGEMDSFTIPQHLRGDPDNPARLLRCRLMAEHLGFSPEMGQALLADPVSALTYYNTRTWYEGCRWQPMTFFGSSVPDVPIGPSASIPGFLLSVLAGAVQDAAKTDVWKLVADPTTTLDPNPAAATGPDYP
jgi:phosphatidylserine/phosphatidylglycerophosphate/cardiolipin synthase-like enzyme